MRDKAITRPRRVRFGAFVADCQTGELWRDGRCVVMQQKPFRLLAALLDRPGELVTREELRYALWSVSTHVAFERGLTVAMAKVRQCLGDSADEARFIETLPGRGYRLIVPVTPVDDSAPTAPAAESRLTDFVRHVVGLAAVLAVVLLSPSRISVTAADRIAAAEALSQYACQLKSSGQFEEGLAVIRRAHALAPEVARFTAEVGLHLHANRMYDEEMRMLRLAVAQDPQSEHAWFHLGLGLARREQMTDAVAALETAVTLNPGDAEVRWWLTWANGA